MYSCTIEHVQEYNHHLSQKYKALCGNYNKLRSEVDKLYKDNLCNDVYEDKLLNHVDDISVNAFSKEIFRKYEVSKKEVIKRHLDSYYYLNENTISKIFDVREKMLNKKIDSLTLNNIGTSMNILREFYNDVQIDIERNKKNEIGNSISYKDSLIYELNTIYNNNKIISKDWNIKVESGDK